MKWINIAGFILQFISFWFAAPELLGADTLKRFENGLVKLLSRLPSILLGLVGFVVGTIMAIYGVSQGLSAKNQSTDKTIQAMVIIIIISILYMIYMIFFYKKVQKWIERIFAQPTVLKLISNNETRKVALITGAILFTIGFFCQLMALIYS